MATKTFSNRLVLAALGLSFLAVLVLGAGIAEARNPKIAVSVGQSRTQSTPTLIKTVSIADSKVADVVVAGPREILINGKKTGFTTLVVWDENNVSTTYNVVVRGAFSDQKIELRVQVAEINRSKAVELGVDFLFNDVGTGNTWTGGSYGGKVATPAIPLEIFNDVTPEGSERGAGPVGGSSEGVDLALRYISGGTNIQTMVRALQEDGVAKLLAEPNVVTASGHEANFLSGGEFPVPIAQSSGGGGSGGSTITIEYKEFGVKVDFLPTIVDSGVISLEVAPEVSRLDFANAVTVSGFRVPSIIVRRAKTTVELEDGQVLVIGGLLLETEEEINSKIPILGHIPLIGLLFSHSETRTTQQELLIVVSPHIIHALPRGTEVALPGVEEDEG